MVLNIMVNGTKINNMVMVSKHGQIPQNMKVIIKWVKKMVRVISYGVIHHHIKDNSMIIIFMGVEFINGLMKDNMMENGKIIKCMVEVYFYGMMVEDMRENILKIKNKDMEFSHGLIKDNTKDNGITENNTEREFILVQMEFQEEENGKMEREKNG